MKSAAITTKLGITWTNTIKYSIYSLKKISNNNIPSHLYFTLFHHERTKEKDQVKLELLEETKTIYPITASAASEDLTLLALGLRDGTAQIWDINTGVLKYNFDKHSAPVKCLSFFEIYKLISGGEDGSVMIHDLETIETVMKRTNLFESKLPYSILKIKVSDAGVAFVLDSLGNIKIYDLWRNEKVGVLAASPPQRHTNKFKKWNVETPTILVVNGKFISIQINSSYSLIT